MTKNIVDKNEISILSSRHTHKKVFLVFTLMLFSVFLVTTVSAFEFDNKLTYSENDLKINLTNWFGLGVDYGSAELKSHNSVNEILQFGYGKEEVVIYYDFNFKELYEDGLGEVYFIDERTGKSVEKNYSFVYWANETYEINVYEEQCLTLGNGTENCENVFVKKENRTKGVWKPYNSKNIPKDNIRIGLKTYVDKDDYLDAVWTIAGKKVTKHAVWTASLNVGLSIYLKLNESSGILIDSLGQVNFSDEGTPIYGAVGIIGGAISFDSNDDDFINTSASNISTFNHGSTSDFSYSFWFNTTSNPTDIRIFETQGTDLINCAVATGLIRCQHQTADNVFLDITEQTYRDGNAHHYVFKRNNSGQDFWFYMDGALNKSATGRTPGTVTTTDFFFGDKRADRFIDGIIDEFSVWARDLSQQEITQIFNGGLGITHTTFFIPIITLNSPINNFNTSNASINFNGTISVSSPDNVTLFIDDVGNETNSTGILGDYIFTKIISQGSHTWNYESCNINGCDNGTERTFTITLFVENEVFFNASTFETASETFTTNITTNGTAPTSASLIYNGTEFTGATITSLGENDYNISRTIDIPLINGDNTPFHFNFSIASTEVSTNNRDQSVNLTTFEFCETGQQPTYINFTFTNETIAEEAINAEIDTTWNFWLGSGSIIDSLSFTNTTENLNYGFCLTSGGNRTLNANVTMTYNNNLSQQRNFADLFVLTNTTTTQNLFLLPTADGIFVTFQVINPASQIIQGVSSNVTKGGTLISSGITDDAGLITYFLDPDTSYVFSFSKEGFTTVIITLVPTQNSFTIVMGTTVTISQFDTTRGISYQIKPIDLTLINGTLVNFNLTLNSTFHLLEQFGFVLKNSTGTVFNVTTSTTDTGGFLSQTLDTGNNTDIVMEIFWTITGNQTNVTRIWLVFNLENEGFSVLTFFNDLTTFTNSDLFGLNDFGLGIIIFLIILVSTGVVSFKYGITSPPGISIIVFSLVAFFDVALGIMPNPINAVPNFPTIFVGIIFLGVLYSEVIR